MCSQRRISEIFRTGSVLFNHPLKVLYLPNDTQLSRVVISVPKRLFKRAVKRNQIKRQIREILRKAHFRDFTTTGVDLCLLFIGKEIPDYKFLNEKIKDVLGKISKRVESGTLPSSDNID
ncbi:MAG: ribonuclease P protein component [Bacteroidetes bacterium GWF2_41_61]|nr:MAG: ribonuclease P protein component [Bacteroidetes bacterium GWF2_41_61]OFY90923.1 MAG: ribonuclease P protein component [Bacteroidetes bacterium RIFOXYA12_FULL_40_10]